MTLVSPYQNQGSWYRGSLHIHSNFSVCGWHSMEELALAYRDYDFIALTDHNQITTETGPLENHVIFRGMEVGGERHMLLVNQQPPLEEPADPTFSLEHFSSLAEQTTQNEGLAIASHPMRLFGQHWSLEELLAMKGLCGMEVFSGDGILVEQDVGFELWDQVLTAGKKLWGFGNDDFHHWGQERRVWNVVNAKEKTPQGILQALRAGDFYISSGFGFDCIRVEGNTVHFEMKGGAPQLENAYKYLTLYGSGGRVLAEQTGSFQSCTYTATGDEGYIRAEAYMSGGYGAFSQPIYVM